MLRRAVDVFGFHLAGLDLRQNSDVHALTIGELFEQAGIELSYTDLPEPERTALLRRELTSARPLASPFLTYSERTASELKILGEAAHAIAATAIPPFQTTSFRKRTGSRTCSRPRCC
jgi:phosphoenolpyruvate carboxylase